MRSKRKLQKLKAAHAEALLKLDEARDWEEHQFYQEVVAALREGIEELEAAQAPLPQPMPWEQPIATAPPPVVDGGFFGTAQLLDVLAKQQPMEAMEAAATSDARAPSSTPSSYLWSPTMLNLLQVPPQPPQTTAMPPPTTAPPPPPA